jgi:hypothetical protein
MPRRLLAVAVVLLGSSLLAALTPAIAENAAKLQDISFDDLKFDIKPAVRFEESMLTEKIKGFEGQPIRIRGVMMPSFQQKGIKHFILLMNAECQFGSTKDPVWCNIRVNMDDKEAASFTTRPITVEGKLKLDVMEGEDYDLSIYMLDGAKVTK